MIYMFNLLVLIHVNFKSAYKCKTKYRLYLRQCDNNQTQQVQTGVGIGVTNISCGLFPHQYLKTSKKTGQGQMRVTQHWSSFLRLLTGGTLSEINNTIL